MSHQQQRQVFRYLAVLDFEATCDDKDRRAFGPQEIIEFPLVVIDTHTPSHTDPYRHSHLEFHRYVRPTANPRLTEFCTELTGIQQGTVDAAQPFRTVLDDFTEFVNTHAFTTENTLVITCGEWDLRTMLGIQMRQLTSSPPVAVPELLTRWCNIKTAFAAWRGPSATSSPPPPRGMTCMLRELGIELVGRHHSGIDDSRSIAAIVEKMVAGGWVFQTTSASKKAAAPTNEVKPATATAAVAAAASKAAQPPRQPKQPKQSTKAAPPPTPNYGAIVDIGANLTNSAFSDLHRTLKRAKEVGIETIIVTGTSVKASVDAVKICREWNAKNTAGELPHLVCTIGVHPHDSSHGATNPDGTIATLRNLITSNRDIVVAAGECGLDFDRNFSKPADQLLMFERQARLAAELDVPLFLHERSAPAEFLEILRRVQRETGKPCKGVLHCFTGEDEAYLKECLDLGLYVGITGWVTDTRPGRGSGLAAIVSHIPRDRLLVETDAPYLSPRNLKPLPRNNEPALLPWVVQEVARLYGVDGSDVASWSTENAKRLFGI